MARRAHGIGRGRWPAAAGIVVALVALAACSGGDDDAAAPPTTVGPQPGGAATAAPPTTVAAPAIPTPPPEIESAEGCSMAPTPPFVGAIPMKRLDHNDRVRQLQQMLTTLGFSVGTSGPDGEFSPETEDAFELWQSQQGMPVTGIVCMEDWYALVNATGGDGTATSVTG